MSIKPDHWIRDKCDDRIFIGTLKLNGVPQEKQKLHLTCKQVIGHQQLNPEYKQDILALSAGESREYEDVLFECVAQEPMIFPFVNGSFNSLLVGDQTKKCPSYGLSSYGYDIRLGRNFKLFNKMWPPEYNGCDMHWIKPTPDYEIVDILNPPDGLYKNIDDVGSIVIPSNSMALGVSIERICMPRNVTATCMPKSTLARAGIIADITPIEAGWKGYVTLELYNKTPNPIRIYSGMGIMQLIFHEGEHCETSYADRNGKYMDQPAEPIVARL